MSAERDGDGNWVVRVAGYATANGTFSLVRMNSDLLSLRQVPAEGPKR